MISEYINNCFNDVVVLILNYRSSALSIGCAENILSIGQGISIVIVDNNSNDDSFDLISKRFANLDFMCHFNITDLPAQSLPLM